MTVNATAPGDRPSASDGRHPPALGQNRDPSGTEKRLEKVLALFGHLRGLDAEVDFEHSFKAIHGLLLEDRFLLGVNRRDIESKSDERICAICKKIGMPPNLLASFRELLPDANHVYFGVQRDGQSLIFKAYVERRDKIEQEIASTPVAGRSYPLFTGFKWDTFAPARQAVTRYDWYPSLPAPDIIKRMQTAAGSGRHGGLVDITRDVIERALKRISHNDIQYLEVSEEGNPRRSFDINFYKAGLRLENLSACLLAVQRHYAIPPERFESLYQRIRTERFGHLAGGVDRDSNDFMSIYYGAKRLHVGQLGSAVVVA